jgi:DNA (cytosine-5)-methyltransferase 1
MSAYYNEIDAVAAQWLRNLIEAGHIAPGDVDERSITEVTANDLRGYTQAHFFAGIGGWSLALRLAGWPDSKPVWTGSCPCQPFSIAGKQTGASDERHLWPAFQRLIAQQKPTTVFGEQVASKAGRLWLSAVRLDLEELGYACGAADLPSICVDSWQRRERLYWGATNTDSKQQHTVLDGSGKKRGGATSPAREVDFVDCTIRSLGRRFRIPEPRGGWLANGIPGRVGQLRAYGNAIVPQVAAEFIAAYMDAVKTINAKHK